MTVHVDRLHFAYGDGPPALAGVDLRADAGEVILLTGPSGGGKSTLLRALCGLVPHFHGGTVSGRVTVAGRDPLRQGPGPLAGRVSYLFQEPEAQAVFDTVDRDIAFGPRALGWPGRRVEQAVARAAAEVGADGLLGREIATLSGGERQRAALAAVLATRPQVLLLDEPTSQLDADGVEGLIALIHTLSRQGTTVVVAEHRTEQLEALECRRVAVGRAAPAPAPSPAEIPAEGPRGRPLRVTNLRCGHGDRVVVSGLTASFRPGAITALEGPNGAGKSTVLRAIAGHLEPMEGDVRLGDRALTGPPEARFPQLAYVAQDAARHMLTESVRDEVEYGLRWTGTPAPSARRRAAGIARELGITELGERHPRDLSVGQRQLVALAGALALEPAVLVLDEPTRGLDPGRQALLVAALTRRARRGTTVVLASHDRAFAAAVADARIALRAAVTDRETAPT